MNALDRIFQAYDAIRTEGHTEENDAPPWKPPADPTPTGGRLPRRFLKVVHLKRPKGTVSWGDVRAEKEERAQKLLEDRYHESHSNKLLNDREEMPNGGVSFAQDEKGMDAGYGYRSFPGASYDENTGTLYVAGSDSWRSWYDDFTKIPAWGKTTDAERYQQAERAYNDLTQKYGKSVHRVVGHSLGGSVALELAKNKGIEFSRTFGAPVVDPNPFHRGSVERYRHPLDPVSILDRGATWAPLRLYPHSYGGFKGTFDSPNQTAPDHMMLALRQRNSSH